MDKNLLKNSLVNSVYEYRWHLLLNDKDKRLKVLCNCNRRPLHSWASVNPGPYGTKKICHIHYYQLINEIEENACASIFILFRNTKSPNDVPAQAYFLLNYRPSFGDYVWSIIPSLVQYLYNFQ